MEKCPCKICGKDCTVGDENISFIDGVKYKDGTYECMDCRFDIAAKKAEEIKKETGKQICLTCYAESGSVHFL
jgi:hypothetical protein